MKAGAITWWSCKSSLKLKFGDLESVLDLVAEDHDEAVEDCEEEDDGDKAIGHDVVTRLHLGQVRLQHPLLS